LSLSLSSEVSTDYSQSALRFGLIDIKPIEVVETLKRFGMKFKRVTRTFENLKPSQSYADFVTLNNELIFGKIDIPNWFDQEKLVKVYSQRSIDLYKKDTELQNAIKELRESKQFGRPLLSFIRYMISRCESEREEDLEIEAHRFLYSNFPLSFYSKFVVFDNAYRDSLKVLEQIVRIHEFRARSARNFMMYSRHIDRLKKAASPIIDQIETCLFSASCLKKFVAIWNAKSYDEIRYPEFLDFGKIDYSKFEELNNDFKTQLKATRKLLLDFDSNILQEELKLESEPTAKMFGKLVMFPSSSFER
jgi:hypothetical protein